MRIKLTLALVCALMLLTLSASHAAHDVPSVVKALAQAFHINSTYLLALGEVESGLRADAVGGCGERGPLQILPSTFRAYGGKNLSNWLETTAVSVRYFRDCLDAAKGDYRLAAIYYNAGIGNKPSRSRRYASEVSRHYHARLIREGVERTSTILAKNPPNRVVNTKRLENLHKGFDLRTFGLSNGRQLDVANSVL